MTTLFLVIGAALSVSFLCSVLEAVLLSITHSYVAVLEDRGRPVGAVLARMRARIDEPIAAILTLNTIAHTVGAALGGALALQVFGNEWVAMFSAILTLAVLVFSEILPKTLGATHWQMLAPLAARVLQVMILVMKPILIPLAWFNRLVSPPGADRPTVSRAELEVLAEIGRREGTIDPDEWQVVSAVMNLHEVRVGDVMTPRTSMVAIPVEATVQESRDLMIDEGHLRLPVFEETLDEIVGLLLARDLWRADREGITLIRELLREPHFVPESRTVEDLIRDMRERRIQMSIVLDEFGGTAGLVTLEDLLEEIVGEIHDEHDQEPLPFEEAVAGREARVAGTVTLHDMNERYGLELPEDVYDTVGGFVFGQLGRIAEVGDVVEFPGGSFRVLVMDGRRVARVAFTPGEESEGAGGE